MVSLKASITTIYHTLCHLVGVGRIEPPIPERANYSLDSDEYNFDQPLRYSDEVLEAIIETLQRLQDVVGYHFSWCLAYGESQPLPCTCGMELMRVGKSRLINERMHRFIIKQEREDNFLDV